MVFDRFLILACIFAAALPPFQAFSSDLPLTAVPESIPQKYVIPEEIYSLNGIERAYSAFPLRIAHISDIHHYSENLYDADSAVFKQFALNNEGRSVQYSTTFLSLLKEQLVRKEVEILLVSGDLTVLGAQQTHLDAARIFKGFEKAGIEVFVTTGNHDVNNPGAFRITDAGAKEIESVTPSDFRRIYRKYGFDQAIMVHDESLSYLAELDKNVMLLALDTSYYQDNYWFGRPMVQGMIVPSLYAFTEKALNYASSADCEVIVMGHHNFLEHYEIDFDLSNFLINDEGRMMKLLAEHGVKLTLSGHIHKTDIKTVPVEGVNFTGAAVTSFAMYPHTYRIIGLGADGAGLSDFSLNTVMKADDEIDILNYSWYIYYRRNFIDNYQRLLSSYSPDDAYQMAYYFYLANLYSQQGLERYLSKEVINSKGAKLYIESDVFMKDFASALPLDTPPADQNIYIDWSD